MLCVGQCLQEQPGNRKIPFGCFCSGCRLPGGFFAPLFLLLTAGWGGGGGGGGEEIPRIIGTLKYT